MTDPIRDPRVDPRQGDIVISAKGRQRAVVYVTLHDLVVYDDQWGNQKDCKLATWKRWAKGGKIERRRTVPEAIYAEKVRTTYAIRGQITLLANEIMSEENQSTSATLRPTITCTPDHETRTALMELGLALYLANPYRLRATLRERVRALYERGT